MQVISVALLLFLQVQFGLVLWVLFGPVAPGVVVPSCVGQPVGPAEEMVDKRESCCLIAGGSVVGGRV